MLVTLMFAPACGLDMSRPASTSRVGGAQSARPMSLSAATAWRVRFRSPVVTLMRRRRSSMAISPVAPHADRAEDADLFGHPFAARFEPAVQRLRDDRKHCVVDGAAEAILERFER